MDTEDGEKERRRVSKLNSKSIANQSHFLFLSTELFDSRTSVCLRVERWAFPLKNASTHFPARFLFESPTLSIVEHRSAFARIDRRVPMTTRYVLWLSLSLFLSPLANSSTRSLSSQISLQLEKLELK